MYTYEFIAGTNDAGQPVFHIIEVDDQQRRTAVHFPNDRPAISFKEVAGFDRLFEFRSEKKNFQFYRNQVVAPVTADDLLLMDDLIDIIYVCGCPQGAGGDIVCPDGYEGVFPIIVTNGYPGCEIAIDPGSVILRGAFVFPFDTTQTQSGNGAAWNNNNNTFTPRVLIPQDYTQARYAVRAKKSDDDAIFECSILPINPDGSISATPVPGSIINPAFDDVTNDFIFEQSPFFSITATEQYVFAIRKVSGTGNLEVSTVTMEAIQ